jgi:hypothetical protein
MDDYSDTESIQSFSSITAQNGQNVRKQDEVQRRLLEALEVLHSFPMPIAHHNRIKDKKNQNVDWKEEFCVRAWNETIEELEPVVKTIVSESKNEPDGPIGGKRYIKQEIEYLLIEKWVRLVMNAHINCLKSNFDMKYNKNNIHIANDAWKIYFDTFYNSEETIRRIVKNVRSIFLHEKIFVHTIKGKDTQRIPVLKDFFENPSIKTFETLVKYHWKYHIKARRELKKRIWDQIDADIILPSILQKHVDIESITKRARHSDNEKRRIKNKTKCKCVGLPDGLQKCSNNGKQLPYSLLYHEHRLPVAVFNDESDQNRWGMCGNCHDFKTHYIDKHLQQNKNNKQIIYDFKNFYILPEELIQKILLEVKLDTPEYVECKM